jgi:hypothetical protein
LIEIAPPRQLNRYVFDLLTMSTENLTCKFCGQTLSATATECDRCGGGTPYGLAIIEEQEALEFVDSQRWEYDMVQIPPNITVKQASGYEAANYLQRIVNDHASRGWEFVRVDTIGVNTPPGCLAGLLGGQSAVRQYYVVTFRREFQRQRV